MWLDRFSGHSNNSGSNTPYSRSYSPVPRRSSHLVAVGQPGRHGYSPRSSSLSLSITPNDSANPLQAALRQGSGSVPKQSSPAQSSSGIHDPLETLKSIIGERCKDDVSEGPVAIVANSKKPVQFVESIDFGNLSLEEFLESENRNARTVRTNEGIQIAEQCGSYQFDVRLYVRLCSCFV